MANAQFSVAALDPDTIKKNFIKWASSQPQYSGYNFEGANFNAILDVLSRNASLEAFYINMAYNETFLDSAQTLDAVISRAKEMNYCPSSMGSSSTSLNIVIKTDGAVNFSIPFGTRFNGINSNASFTFTTDDNYYKTSTTGNYTFSNVAIYEGNYINEVYSINNNITNQRIMLSNPSIDTNSLKVLVSENGNSLTEYKLATNIYNINGNSNVYFLQGGKGGTYEIYFGDSVLGHQPLSGSIAQIYYRACSGPAADSINSFSLLDNLGSLNNCLITSISITGNSSFGGTLSETIDSIRFNAPRNVQTQERAATANDYETLITKKFPQVGDVSAFKGGVNSNGVFYGTVFLSCVTPTGNPLTQTLKEQIVSYCSELDLIHPQTQVIDASTLYVDASANVHVDFNITNNSISFYEKNVANAIINFSNNNIQKYKKVLRYSKLSDSIDSVDNNAIISNELDLTVKRLIQIPINIDTTVVTSFSNPVKNINSDQYIYNGLTTYITDVVNNYSNGIIYNVFLNTNNSIISYDSIGKIDYDTGYVNISKINISQYLSNNSLFYIYATPKNKDIYPANNDIIKIDTNGITVSISSN